ncbi:MAG: glycosyltransferase family 39 protein [Planctomycetota bacterium]|nr:glycosyltransferase family 39 protein [Planctomycetota bacterium]
MKLDVWLRVLLVLGVALHVAGFLYVTFQRISYPFELEWMEGALVDHTSRILRGEDIYTAPSIEHTSYLYTPLYYYVSALVSSWTGVGLFPLRLVSLVASLGCALCIALIVKREATNGGFVPAMVGGGFFLAGFWLVDGWHDLARNDSLFLLLILITVMLLRADTDRRALLAGIVVMLAFLSKQLTLALLPPLAIGMACLSIRRAVLFTISTSVCLAVTVGLYSWLTDGWFFYYIFEVPGQHPSVAGIEFWWQDMRPMWISLAVGLFWFVTGLGWAERRRTLFYTCVAGGLLASAHIARHHAGGHINALMPWLVGGGLLMGLALLRGTSCHGGVRLGLTIAMIGQFALMVETSKSFLPSPEHRQEFEKFYSFVRGVEGQVFVPSHGHVAEAVGKTGSMHGMAMHDLQSSQTEGYQTLLQSIGEAYSDRRFQVIVISEPHAAMFLGAGSRSILGYRLLENPPFDHRAMKPLHGMFTTPALVFERVD